MFLGALATVVVGFWLVFNHQTAGLSAAVVLFGLLAIYSLSKPTGIYCALLYLILLGDIRRIGTWINGFSAIDLLVLVGPVFAALITLPVFLRIRLKDTPSKLVLALMVMMLLELANPAQGGILVGLGGLVITLPPLLWFWIGRTNGSEKMLRVIVYKILIPAALVGSLIGMYQTIVGVPFWQQEWVTRQLSSHNVIFLGTGIRGFGFSNAASEYVNLLGLASSFCVIGAISGRRVLLLPLPVLLPALFLATSRGPIFHLLAAAAIGYAFKSRNKVGLPVRLGFALVVCFGGLTLGLSQHGDYVTPEHGATATDLALAHQVNGLAHPLNSKYSTAGMHAAEIGEGFLAALRRPIGYGTGAATGAAGKYATGGQQVSAEFDVADVFLDLGIPGGVCFVCFIFTMIRLAYRYAQAGPTSLSLAILPMMIVQVGAWFFTNEYSNGAFFFFLLGSLVRITDPTPTTDVAATAAFGGSARLRPVTV